MNGGKVIWLVESLIADMDSMKTNGSFMTANYNHNLDNLLFKYGAKIQPTLVQDLQCHGILIQDRWVNTPNHCAISRVINYPITL